MTINEDDMDEASMSGAAGAYNTPYAFNKNKKAVGTDDDSASTMASIDIKLRCKIL